MADAVFAEAWHEGFFLGHMKRVRRHDWPTDGEYWTAFSRSLARHRVNEAVAVAASELVSEGPDDYQGERINALILKCKLVHKQSEVPNKPQLHDPSPTALDRAVDREWERADEETREYWLRLARERYPELADRAWWVTGMAKNWNHDPSLVPPPRAPDEPNGIGRPARERPRLPSGTQWREKPK
jgi:hypothetical protein